MSTGAPSISDFPELSEMLAERKDRDRSCTFASWVSPCHECIKFGNSRCSFAKYSEWLRFTRSEDHKLMSQFSELRISVLGTRAHFKPENSQDSALFKRLKHYWCLYPFVQALFESIETSFDDSAITIIVDSSGFTSGFSLE
ncbi:hypothetical protein B0H10DRAFT_1968812 [Mycena sp. CBHHK59/15]|nr:hypothetical protein B0H10DRAFT_1968812 [Mycena sp. CBHHK59/15]